MTLDIKMDQILGQIKGCKEKYGIYDYHATYHAAVFKHIEIPGLWAEFGVYRGTSMSQISAFAKEKDPNTSWVLKS